MACIFCKIVAGEIPAEVVEQTADAIVIADVNPQAPSHFLVIPTRHADNLGDFAAATGADEVGELFALASRVGRAASARGYRLVVNEGEEGGQTVGHLHVHVLAGRHMHWPPG